MPEKKSKLTFPVLLVTYLVLSGESALAQGICDVKSFRLNKLKGEVVSAGSRGFEPIAQAKVELWRLGGEDEDDTLLATTFSDEKGSFEISDTKEGRYRLEVSKWESGFVRYFAEVTVVKKVKESDRGRQLIVRLGVEALKPCGGGGDISIAWTPRRRPTARR